MVVRIKRARERVNRDKTMGERKKGIGMDIRTVEYK